MTATTLDELFETEFESMVRLARVISDRSADVEDIVMDAFEQTANRFGQLREPGGYLRTAVINGARRRYRNRKRRESIIKTNAPRLIERGSEPGEYIADVLGRLPERERTVIVLVYYSGLTPTEVADILSCPAGTVRSILHRTLQRLRLEVSA